MAALNFPLNPAIGDTHTVGQTTWLWNGVVWDSFNTPIVAEVTGDFLVRFIDYDGTVLKEEWVDSGEDATPPTLPDHSADCSGGGLTFQEWNNPYTNITQDLDIGATYIPADGKTHIKINLNTSTGLGVPIYLNKSDGSTLTVDWGDGTQSTFTNVANFNTGIHTYATIGAYEITMWISVGTGTYSFSGQSTTNLLFGTNYNLLNSIYVGSNIIELKSYCFYLQRMSKYLTLPNTVQTLTSTALKIFAGCSFRCIVIPSGITTIPVSTFDSNFYLVECVLPLTITGFVVGGGAYTFRGCHSLKKINYLPVLTTLPTYGFQNCEALESIRLPDTMTQLIQQSCFDTCYNLKVIELSNTTGFNASCLKNAGIKKLVCNSNIFTIESEAFSGCRNCYEYSFLNNTVVPTLANTNAFYDINPACIIKVPLALEPAWKAATNWATYADYIVGV